MDRRNFIRSAGVAAAAAPALAAPALAQSMPELKWRMTSSFPKALDTIFGAAETFSKYIAEATDGKFQIQVFAAGEIVRDSRRRTPRPRDRSRCATRRAIITGARTRPSRWRPPFLRPQFPPAEWLDVLWRWHRPDERVLCHPQADRIPLRQHGAQMGGWFRNEIKSLADLQGLKFRIGGFGGKVISKLAWCRSRSRRRNLPGARKGHHRRRRVGRPL